MAETALMLLRESTLLLLDVGSKDDAKSIVFAQQAIKNMGYIAAQQREDTVQPEHIHEMKRDIDDLLTTLDETNNLFIEYLNDRTHDVTCPALRVAAECECGIDQLLDQQAKILATLAEVRRHVAKR